MRYRNDDLLRALTQHAKKRLQQRGIPLLMIRLIEEFGIHTQQNNGVQMYLDRKARDEVRNLLGSPLYAKLEKHMNAYLIERNGYIITVGHAYRHIRKY